MIWKSFLYFLCFLATAKADLSFKITVVIDAVSEQDFNESSKIVTEAADKIFAARENLEDDDASDHEKKEKVHFLCEIVKALPEQSSIPTAVADR